MFIPSFYNLLKQIALTPYGRVTIGRRWSYGEVGSITSRLKDLHDDLPR